MMYTADVFPGTAPRSVTVPQMPTNPPLGQVVGAGVGWSPSLHASPATTASAARKTPLGMTANDRSGRQGRQLDPPFHGEYVLVRHADLRVPLHEVRGALQPARGDRR